jgi:hypothetical protein
MTTPSDESGEQGNQWQPPAPPPGPPPAYGHPSSPSYGRYGQGEALPPGEQPGYGQPPASGYGQAGQPPWMTGPGDFKPAGQLGGVVITLAAVVTVTDWISAFLSPSANREYADAAIRGRSVASVFTSYDVINAIGSVVMLGAWIATSLWLGRARENAVRLNPAGQRRSSVWVWLGWFVPIVSLWFPKQILDDTIAATAPATDERRPIRTGPYWAAWIALLVLNDVQFQVSLRSTNKIVPGLEFAIAIAATVALVFWIRLVRQISAAQDQLAAAPG